MFVWRHAVWLWSPGFFILPTSEEGPAEYSRLCKRAGFSKDSVSDAPSEGQWLLRSLSATFISVVKKVDQDEWCPPGFPFLPWSVSSLLGDRSTGSVLGEDVSCGNSSQGRESLPELLLENSLMDPGRGSLFISLELCLFNAWTALGTAGSGERLCAR